MIGKIMQNHSFRATSRYVLEKEKAAIIGGNLFGETLDAIVDELALTKALNPEIARPVYHLTQSYTAADKETGKLTPTRLAQLATRHFAGMVVSASEPALLEDTAAFQQRVRQFLREEIHTHSFLIAVHQDREHLHTHLVASRINLRDGKCIPTWYEQVRSKKVCRLLEQQFGLEPVANTRAALDQATRERVVQTATVLAQLEKTGTSLEAADYTLTRQGATLTLRRRHDDSIALKAYQDKQKRWKARGGDLTQEECVYWDAMNQAPAADSNSFEFEALEPTPATIEPVAIEPVAVEPVAVEPALIQALEPQPTAVAPASEAIQPPDPLELIKQQQQQQEQAIKAARELEAVALELAGFLKQKKINFYKGNFYTFGFTEAQQQRLVCQQNEDQSLVFEAVMRQGKWTAIAGQVPPEVKQACLDLKQGQPKPAKVPTQNQATV